MRTSASLEKEARRKTISTEPHEPDRSPDTAVRRAVMCVHPQHDGEGVRVRLGAAPPAREETTALQATPGTREGNAPSTRRASPRPGGRPAHAPIADLFRTREQTPGSYFPSPATGRSPAKAPHRTGRAPGSLGAGGGKQRRNGRRTGSPGA